MAPPPLEIVVGGRTLPVPTGRPFVIGRGPEADLDVGHPRASRRHVVVELTPQGWLLTDASRNGTWVDGRRVTSLSLAGPVSVRLGDTDDSAIVEVRPAPHAPAAPVAEVLTRQGGQTSVRHVGTGRLTIGRLPDNDVVLDDLLVSRRHAELHRTGTSWRIVDLNSGNGTFVNGVRVTTADIGARDVIGIGHALLQLHGDRLVSAEDTGDVGFTVEGASVTTDSGKTLLRDVSFALSGRSLLAVVGPSGAGKSTLLNALTGARPADVGEVRYAGRDLYAEYDELRHRIGLVPQDDVLHPQLTVRRALRYAARLRFPSDVPEADRERRIDEVLAELTLTGQAEQRIDTLSGGQRKRTSVALELLTKPSLLFLDEPTSGLDPGLDKSVMQTLRGLADGARTVVVVTHSVLNLDLCDRLLVLAPGGHVAYFGPPREALEYFRTPDYAEMFLLLEQVPGEQLAQRYRASRQHSEYVAQPTMGMPRIVERAAPTAARRQQGFGTQLSVLCRRYLAVIAADRQYAAFLVGLPLVLAALARLVPGDSGLSTREAVQLKEFQPSQLMLVLILGGALMGIAASIRELVKERPVYVRERAIGLSIPAYLLSKLSVLGLITGLQAAVFTLLALVGRRMPDDAVLLGSGLLEVLLAVVGVTVATMLIGLVVSAAIGNADRGMPLLVLVLMIELVVSGGLFPVFDRPGLEQFAWLVPSRWAYAMGAVTADLNLTAREGPDPLWTHDAAHWLLGAGVLAGMGLVLVVVTGLVVRRLDPVRRRRP
ncbi:FHA domain-containing protein [Pseudonocardia oroxyli]|uniref:FHA modulated ABC efflux pump with fused ATPase and integral membrane subunits n=1 Tax=Pseudonocardia oroxyli TaxID=366584 RepID=A0A1G7VR33_PSEOR|nr:FHA domain-containing protein [Pseudonocardia oroxyli]SDG61869.1 FHA modulated ABC efflux pump with fused ATPase and integral membrane subunits [Pseudonocardia oroxyli]